MTTTNKLDFHTWLRGCLPADNATILHDLTVCRMAVPKSYAELPRTPLELADAMRDLSACGLVRKDGTEWKWMAEKKRDDQGALFA